MISEDRQQFSAMQEPASHAVSVARFVKLSDRRRPLEGECWPGYLSRLAAENCISGGVSVMGQLLGLTAAQIIASEPSVTLRRFGIDLGDTLNQRAGSFSGRQRVAFGTSGRTLKARICVACFSEDLEPYVRARWSMPMTLTCQHHNLLLADRCQCCSRSLDVLRPSLTRCPCGADLLAQPSDQTPLWVERLQSLFPEAFAAQTYQTFASAHPLSQHAARVCNWLAAPIDAETGKRPLKKLDRDGFLSAETGSVIEHLLKLPFESIVASVAAEVDLRSPGHELKRLSTRLKVKSFSSMRRIAEEVRQAFLKSQKEGRAERFVPTAIGGKVRYGVKDLMRLTGLSYQTILRCVDAGDLPGVSYSVRNDGLKAFDIPSEVFDSIRRAYDATDSVDQASEHFGCSADALRGLAMSGCLSVRSIRTTTLGNSTGDRFCPKELRSFADYLFRRAQRGRDLKRERLFFSAWVPGEYTWVGCKRWRRILEAVREGKVRVYKASSVPNALDDLYLLRTDVQRFLGRQYKV